MSDDRNDIADNGLTAGEAPGNRRSEIARPDQTARLLVMAVYLLALAGGALYYRMFQTARYAVALNGQPLVALSARDGCDAAIRQLKRRCAPAAPETVRFNEGALTVVVLKSPMAVSSPEAAEAALARRLTARLDGWGIYINGKPAVMLGSKAAAVETVSLILHQGAGSGGGTPTILQPVRLAPLSQQVAPGTRLVPVMTPADAARELAHPPRRRLVTVKRGDSVSAIAARNRLTVRQIETLNPTLDSRTLQPGDRLRLPDVAAPLTVVLR